MLVRGFKIQTDPQKHEEKGKLVDRQASEKRDHDPEYDQGGQIDDSALDVDLSAEKNAAAPI
jgi:hypothetical protein